MGWAPLYVGYDNYVPGYPVYYNHWSFVPCGNFYGGPVYSYVYPTSWVQTSFYGTTVVTGYVGTNIYGPPQGFIAAHSAVPIRAVPVIHGESPGMASMGGHWGGGAITVFHPASMPAYQPGRSNPAVMREREQPVLAGSESIPQRCGHPQRVGLQQQQPAISGQPRRAANHHPSGKRRAFLLRATSPDADPLAARTDQAHAGCRRGTPPCSGDRGPQPAPNPQPGAGATGTRSATADGPAFQPPAVAPCCGAGGAAANRPVASSGWNNYHSPAPTPAYHPQPIANRPTSANNGSARRTYAPAPANKRR